MSDDNCPGGIHMFGDSCFHQLPQTKEALRGWYDEMLNVVFKTDKDNPYLKNKPRPIDDNIAPWAFMAFIENLDARIRLLEDKK